MVPGSCVVIRRRLSSKYDGRRDPDTGGEAVTEHQFAAGQKLLKQRAQRQMKTDYCGMVQQDFFGNYFGRISHHAEQKDCRIWLDIAIPISTALAIASAIRLSRMKINRHTK